MTEVTKQNPSHEPAEITESFLKGFEMVMGSVVPSSKYFDAKFEHLQTQINMLNRRMDELKDDVNSLRKDMQWRFEQVDKRFEDIERRFDKIDSRFEQIDQKLDKIVERIDTKIDSGLKENRSLIIRLFTFALTFSAVSFAGLMGKLLGLF